MLIKKHEVMLYLNNKMYHIWSYSLYSLINGKINGCGQNTWTVSFTPFMSSLPPLTVWNTIGWIKTVVLLLCCSVRTKINFLCFGDARCLLNVVFSDPAKTVEKAKGMSRENPSVEEKSMFLNNFNFSFYKLHYIQFYYKNPLSQYRKSLKEESSTGLDN